MYRVAVLMSTYNGEKYICEQIDSILCQIDVEISLIIRDDCSTDKTREILRGYSNKYKNITVLYGDDNLGACDSFLSLITHQRGFDYYALADQDDIWNQDKIICAIRKIEIENTDIPVLYHSNLFVADERGILQRISHTKPHEIRNRYAPLISISATGCTIVYNDKLAEIISGKNVSGYSMHDTYLMTVATLFGRVIYDFTPHMLYRQHQNNVVGTYLSKTSLKYLIKKFRDTFCSGKHSVENNARILLDVYQNELNKEDFEIIEKISKYNDGAQEKINLLTDKRLQRGVWRKRDIINVLTSQL